MSAHHACFLSLVACRERDAFETAAKAAHTQLQILGEAGCGGDQHLQELAAELAGLAAEVQQRRHDQAAAAAELSEKAAALSAAEQELEVARSQLAALQPGREGKENRVLSSQDMAATVTSLEAAYSTVEVQMAKLMRRNDELVAERDQLHTKACAALPCPVMCLDACVVGDRNA